MRFFRELSILLSILSVAQVVADATRTDCSAVMGVIDAIGAAYPCIYDCCNSGAPETTTVAPESTVTTTAADTTTSVSTTTDDHFGTYLPNWFVYRKHFMGVPKMNVIGPSVLPEDGTNDYQLFPVTVKHLVPKLTHMYYAFWDLNEDCVVEDVDPDASWYGANSPPTWINVPAGACKGLLNDMMGMKSQFPHMKLLISVGGWTYSKNFSACSATAEKRAKIIKSVFFRINEMDPSWGTASGIWDGVDFDWEFPEVPDGLYPDHADDDWDKYVLLIQEARAVGHKEGRDRVVLSTAVGAGNTLTKLVAKPAVTKAFCDALNYVNIMTYDLHGKWDSTTGHNANFCRDSRHGDPSKGWSVLSTINKFKDAGCSAKKIILGIPGYSHAWTKIPAGTHGNGLFTKASDSKWVGWGTFSDSDKALIPQGILSYWDVKATLRNYADFKVYTFDCPADNGIVVPIKHLYSSQRQAFASYEDPDTVTKKAQWAKKMGLGGLFFWDVQTDRDGDILDAARKGWGATTVHGATGAGKCFDDRKIDYQVDPLTGLPIEKLCQFTNHETSFTPENNSCYNLGQYTKSVCGGKTSKYIGGHRKGSEDCLQLCSPKWGSGEIGPWAGDIVYFACEGETIPEAGTGTPKPPGEGGNKDCKTCDKCIAVPNNNQGATDAHCEPCKRGQQAWWPCTSGTLLCKCA